MEENDIISSGMGDFPDVEKSSVPEILPMMAVRDVVIFNYMIIPLFVGRSTSVSAVNDALTKEKFLMLATQKDASIDDPEPEDIYSVGMACMIMRTLKLPDGRLKVLVQAVSKARIKEVTQKEPHFLARIEIVDDTPVEKITVEVEALMRNVVEQTEKILSLKGVMSSDLMVILNNINDPGRLADLVVSNLQLKTPESQSVLETFDPVARLRKVADFLMKELEVSTMQAKIQSEAKEEMSRTQREYYLREQLQALKKELGDTDERTAEMDELQARFKKTKMPALVKKEGLKQLKRLETMHPDASEANIIRTYIDWILDIPWQKGTKDRIDIKLAKKVLDEDHYGLDKVKERILEYLAVRKLNTKTKGPILCFVGPPGVGKTSLGQSIARAMDRKFHRLSLGGMHDEAEIRGHRRTYIGAMPGKIIQALKQLKTANPVIMIDEVDKIGNDFRGDPASALLEVLDPEQNSSFLDHYMDVRFDLSRVLFLLTANQLDTVPPPLLDRAEIIRLPGYVADEKVEIARKHLWPRLLRENGLTRGDISLAPAALRHLVEDYAREPGVRHLEQLLKKIQRKAAMQLAQQDEFEEKQAGAVAVPLVINTRNLDEFAGKAKYRDKKQHCGVGMATGLAWTAMGGVTLDLEAARVHEDRRGLKLTGQLGKVMQESAEIAYSYITAHLKRYGATPEYFDKAFVHLHVPEGAVPKDGPSAGISMATALLSLALGKAPKAMAMTGELTLTGEVLPIGGEREKLLAAKRLGINEVILPEGNRVDVEELSAKVVEGVRIHYVKHFDEVVALMFGIRPKLKRKTKKSGKL